MCHVFCSELSQLSADLGLKRVLATDRGGGGVMEQGGGALELWLIFFHTQSPWHFELSRLPVEAPTWVSTGLVGPAPLLAAEAGAPVLFMARAS